jgi:hypothetical protein
MLASSRGEQSMLHTFDRPDKAGLPRFLFVAYFDPRGLKTIVENIEEWCGNSRYRYQLLNLFDFPGRGGLRIPRWVNLNEYDGIVLHCTTSYSADNLVQLDVDTGTKLSAYQGLKVLMKQDEHYRTAQIAEFIKSRGVDLVVTLVEPDCVREFYPEALVGTVAFQYAYTGYVSKELRSIEAPPLAGRPIDVGYRGSMQPLNFGTLAYEKREIGDRFGAVCKDKKLICDISSRSEDRFLGNAWLEFLCRIKATLGVESGASIVDFDGEVERKVQSFLRSRPAAQFLDLHESVLKPYEGNAHYRAISPRHLEAAACKTVQVLYEGRYSGILHAHDHYIPLKRDFANIDEVVRRMRDIPYCQDMADRAYEEVVLNPHYSYDAFVNEFDARAAELLAAKGGAR